MVWATEVGTSEKVSKKKTGLAIGPLGPHSEAHTIANSFSTDLFFSEVFFINGEVRVSSQKIQLYG